MGGVLKLILVCVFWRDFRCANRFAVSVEDASKCKRPISVPGVVVNVRRVVVGDKLVSMIIEPNYHSDK